MGKISSSPHHPKTLAKPRNSWTYWVIGVAILVVHAALLHFMGRIPWCKCGFAIWTPNAWSSDTSQQLLDPYSFTHVIHGIFFYWLLRHVAKRLTIRQRLILTMLIEVGWELLENSPIIINRYRATTASLDYTGDSIVNSVGDVLSCVLGFWLASRLPAKVSVGLVLFIEVGLLLTIRDNLMLNVLMLFHQVPAIKQWQLGH
jgi:hypothetical protein